MVNATLTKLKIAGIAVLALLVLIVVLQNRQVVDTQLLFVTVTMPNAALLFGTLLVGVAIGMLTTWHIMTRPKQRPPS